MISVIMPAYNCEKYIGHAIASVLAQSYGDFELLIVDDASDDGTCDVIRSFEDNRIRFFQNNGRLGAALCRNFAIRNAKGDYIAFLDSDDMWHPEKLKKQLLFMEQNNVKFCYTEYQEMAEDGTLLNRYVSGPKTVSKTGMYAYCWPGCLTVMYHKDTVGDIEIYPIEKNNDYAMWLKIIRKAKLVLLPACLATYRKRDGSVSGTSKKTLIRYHYLLYRLCDNKGKIKSFLLTALNIVCGAYKKIRYVKKSED
ncbi:MAG: glycosyltransferase family 2 protein [Clostridia bacterium]|nr:glycosyltransferase family 2 protein [Clostridia bacterium]